MFLLYNLLFYLLHPLIRIFLLFRVIKNKEDKERYHEKLGFLKYKATPGVIWFHVASLGELKSIHRREGVLQLVSPEYPVGRSYLY